MDIEYFAPLGRAFDRMKRALFHPFDLRKWFIVGFAAFLAGLTDARSGGGFWGNPAGKRKGGDPGDIFRMPYEVWNWIVAHPGWMIAIAVLLLVGIAIGIALAWVSARAKFVFLDNVSATMHSSPGPGGSTAGKGIRSSSGTWSWASPVA
jgi:hypothetical protein